MAVIETHGLTKRFGDVVAVDTLDLAVPEGTIYGFLGPNGAGKSTTINLLLDFTKPTSGSARVLDHDTQAESLAIRHRTGTLLEGYGVYPELTGHEHVAHAIETKDADDDPQALVERVGLAADAARRAGGYSKGMAQRLAIAVALVGDPDLLVLDEPSTGLDPNGARTLREVVLEQRAKGTTVFFSSHLLEEVEAVADRVGILLDGRLVGEGDLDTLRAELGGGSTLVVSVSAVPDGLPDAIESIDGIQTAEASSARGEPQLRVTCDGGDAKLAALDRIAEAGVYHDFDVEDTSLGEVFSRYTEDRGAITVGDGDVE